MARGRFITFEGGEGAGKTTQARRLADHIMARGHQVVVTREPGGSPFAEKVRDLALEAFEPGPCQLAETLLFNAARADHLDKVIRPALDRGRWVICDRFLDSTRVYQGEVGGLEEGVLDSLDEIVVAGTRPDLTVVIDLDPVVGLARVEQRRGAASARDVDRFETRGADYHEKLREGFLKIARREPIRFVVVDGFQSVDLLSADICGHVDARLFRGGR